MNNHNNSCMKLWNLQYCHWMVQFLNVCIPAIRFICFCVSKSQKGGESYKKKRKKSIYTAWEKWTCFISPWFHRLYSHTNATATQYTDIPAGIKSRIDWFREQMGQAKIKTCEVRELFLAEQSCSLPSSSHSSRGLEALSLGSSHDVVFVLWLKGDRRKTITTKSHASGSIVNTCHLSRHLGSIISTFCPYKGSNWTALYLDTKTVTYQHSKKLKKYSGFPCVWITAVKRPCWGE